MKISRRTAIDVALLVQTCPRFTARVIAEAVRRRSRASS